MLQKFKITTCVFILCLFGLTLMTVSPVHAQLSKRGLGCDKMIEGPKSISRKKINCFRNEVKRLNAKMQDQRKGGARAPARPNLAREKGEVRRMAIKILEEWAARNQGK